MRKAPEAPRGRVERLAIQSRALEGNRLGDPALRAVDLYLPAGHAGAGLPLLVLLAGFTGSGLGATGWRAFTENAPERLDRLIASGAMPPVAVAFPDCFTRLGGNQYVNSAVMGLWEDFLIDEMLPEVERRHGCGGPGRRGILGKSSGGYGALMHALRHPDVWAAAACHSGDLGFELCYWADMPRTLRALARHDMSIERFVRAFEASRKPDDKDIHALMTLAMAATYDPDPDPAVFLGIRLPVDPETCEPVAGRWDAWMAHDPVAILDQHADGLRQLRGLFVDCGTADQYNLLYGARRLHRGLTRLAITHRYEEFPDNHSSIDYRMDTSLPFLAQALTRG